MEQEEAKFEDERGSMIIMDRSFDTVSPVMHDLSYWSMLADVVGMNKQFKIERSTAKGARDHVYDNNDRLWKNKCYEHYKGFNQDLNKQIKQFVEANKEVSNAQEGVDFDHQKALGKMSQFADLYFILDSHSDNVKTIDESVQERGLKQLITLESEIILGLSEDGKELSTKNLMSRIRELRGSLEDEDYCRLLMILFSCYNFPSKDQQSLIDSVDDCDFRTAIDNMITKVLKQKSSSKITRVYPTIDKAKYK